MKMTKTFFAAAVSVVLLSAVFAGCDLLEKPDEGNSEQPKITLTVKNESSYVLSGVTFTGIIFGTGGGELPPSSESTKELVNTKSGYLTFTRKDIGIFLRTAELVSMGEKSDTFTVLNSTVVVEQGNEGNRKTLGQISYQSRLAVERGDSSVSKNDIVNLGEAVVDTSVPNVFTIKNTGVGKLLFGINEPVRIEDDGDDVFSVVQPAGPEIAPNASLPFTINFRPKGRQNYGATVRIKSNDENGDYVFTINASGVPTKPIATVLFEGNEIIQEGTIDAGGTLITQPKNITINIGNIGTAVLAVDTAGMAVTGANESAFSLLTKPGNNISAGGQSSFIVKFDPANQGENNAILTIPTNDDSRNPIIIFLKGTAVKGSPVLELRQDATVITNNSPTPVDFGQVNVGDNKPLTFTIRNTGNVALMLNGNPVIESSNNVFSVPVQPNTVVSPGSETTFVLRYAPTGEGESAANIILMNNGDEMQFSFAVKGRGHIRRPQITVRQGGTQINPNGEFQFGSVAVGESDSITFTIANSGEVNLSASGDSWIGISGNRANYFTVTGQPSSATQIVPGGTANFVIRYGPTVADTSVNATVRIDTNSRDDGVFSFTVRGNSFERRPELNVYHGQTAVPQNGRIDAGNVMIVNSQTITVTLENGGDAALVIDTAGIAITGADPRAFVLASTPVGTVQIGSRTSFDIVASPERQGEHNAILTIPSNDSRRNPAIVNLRVTGTAPPYTDISQNTWNNGDMAANGGEQWYRFTATAAAHFIHVDFGTRTNLRVQLFD